MSEFFGSGNHKKTNWNWNEVRVGELCRTLLETGFENDVTLYVGPSKQRIPAHKIILKMRSKFFFKALQENSVSALNVSCDPGYFQALMKFFYTGSPPINTKQALELMKLSYKFEVPSLLLECERIFSSEIDDNNAVAIYSQAMQYSNQRLIKLSLDFICSHANQTLLRPSGPNFEPTPDTLELSSAALLQIIKQDDLELENEFYVFNIVYKWAQSQCRNNGFDEIKPENLKTFLRDLLPHIRFIVMEKDDFVLRVAPTGVLSQEEMLSITMQFLVSVEKRTEVPNAKFLAQPRKGQIKAKLSRKMVFYIDQQSTYVGMQLHNGNQSTYIAQLIGLRLISDVPLRITMLSMVLNLVCSYCRSSVTPEEITCNLRLPGGLQEATAIAVLDSDVKLYTVACDMVLTSGTDNKLGIVAQQLRNKFCQSCGQTRALDYSSRSVTTITTQQLNMIKGVCYENTAGRQSRGSERGIFGVRSFDDRSRNNGGLFGNLSYAEDGQVFGNVSRQSRGEERNMFGIRSFDDRSWSNGGFFGNQSYAEDGQVFGNPTRYKQGEAEIEIKMMAVAAVISSGRNYKVNDIISEIHVEYM